MENDSPKKLKVTQEEEEEAKSMQATEDPKQATEDPMQATEEPKQATEDPMQATEEPKLTEEQRAIFDKRTSDAQEVPDVSHFKPFSVIHSDSKKNKKTKHKTVFFTDLEPDDIVAITGVLQNPDSDTRFVVNGSKRVNYKVALAKVLFPGHVFYMGKESDAEYPDMNIDVGTVPDYVYQKEEIFNELSDCERVISTAPIFELIEFAREEGKTFDDVGILSVAGSFNIRATNEMGGLKENTVDVRKLFPVADFYYLESFPMIGEENTMKELPKNASKELMQISEHWNNHIKEDSFKSMLKHQKIMEETEGKDPKKYEKAKCSYDRNEKCVKSIQEHPNQFLTVDSMTGLVLNMPEKLRQRFFVHAKLVEYDIYPVFDLAEPEDREADCFLVPYTALSCFIEDPKKPETQLKDRQRLKEVKTAFNKVMNDALREYVTRSIENAGSV